MSTSPGPGVGIGTSSIVKGLPNACTTPAFIVLAMLASPIPLRARARLGWPHLDHLVLNTQLIAGAHWVRPAKFVEAGAHDATSGLELALDQEPHGERRRVPTARRQSAEDAVTGGIVIEMERLRIELGSEALDPITLDADATWPTAKSSRYRGVISMPPPTKTPPRVRAMTSSICRTRRRQQLRRQRLGRRSQALRPARRTLRRD